MNFDPVLARTVALPLVRAAYAVDTAHPEAPALPPGFIQTALVQTDRAYLARVADRPPGEGSAAERAALADDPVFGLVGQNAQTKTAFLAIRGTRDLREWVADFDAATAPYQELQHFGDVHAGFQSIYAAIRDSLRSGLPGACAGCTALLVAGHSLGGALAVLAAPDLLVNLPPRLAPQLITFGGPRVGLASFTGPFDAAITSCYRVVNFLDIVPTVPPAPYVHVGTGITIDSGGSIDPVTRHGLDAYGAGLAKLDASAMSNLGARWAGN